MKSYIICQCCGKKYNISKYETNLYTICPNCDWEEDTVKINESSPSNNNLTILEARNNIKKFGNIYGIRRWCQLRKAKLYLN